MKNYFYLAAIVLIGLIVAIPQLYHPMNSEPDAYSRALWALKTYQQGDFFAPLILGKTWLPLHPIILGISLVIYENIYITPRLLSLFFSLGSVFIMFFYANLVVKNKSAALLSSLLYAIFPLRLYLSTQTLSEPVFVFFFSAALVFLFKSRPNYVAGLLALNIAHGLRYDSWIMLPIFFWKFWTEQPRQKRIKLIMAACLFPLFWVFINAFHQENPLAFFIEKYSPAQAAPIPQFWNLPASLTSWLEKIMDVLTVPGVVLWLFGGYKLIKSSANENNVFLLTLAPVYYVIILIVQVFLGTMERLPHRYLSTPIYMIFPMISLGIFQFIKECSRFSHSRRIIIYLSGWMIIIFSLITLGRHSKLYAGGDYFDQQEVSKVIDVIEKTRNPDRKQIFYYHNSAGERFWLEPVIGYFTSRNDIIIYPNTDIGKFNYGVDDLIIVENPSPYFFSPDRYRQIFNGKKLAIFVPI